MNHPRAFSDPNVRCDDCRACDRTFATCISWDNVINAVALRIRQTLDLTVILQTTIDEVHQLLRCDRVLIYQFSPDKSGRVVAEAISQPQWSLIDRVIHDPCFESTWLEPYREKRHFAIADISTADLTPCHAELLAKFQVQANLAIPILKEESLWGLLIAHHCQAPRPWQAVEIEGLQLLATQVGIAIYQADLIAQLQAANTTLEAEVADRTRELTRTNQALQVANHKLEQANRSLQAVNQALMGKVDEYNQVATEVIHQKAFLQQVLDSLVTFVGVMTPDGRLVEVNQAPLALAGLTRDDVIGHPFADTYWWADTPATQAAIATAIATASQGTPMRCDIPMHIQGGQQITIDFALVPLRDPETGQITHLISSGVDVSDRRQAEAERTRLLNMIEASLNEIYLFNAETLRFEYANQGALHNLGYRLEQLQQMTAVDLKPDLTGPAFETLIAPLRGHHLPQLHFETVHQRADGSRYPVDVYLQLIHQDDQPRFLAIVLDITERKQAEVSLQQSEATKRALIQAIPDFLVRMRQDGTQLEVINTGNVNCLRPEPAPIEGHNVIDIMPAPIAQERITLAQVAIATKKTQKQEFSFTQNDKIYYEEARISAISNDEVLVMVRDISNRKQAEFKLRERERDYRLLIENLPAGIVVHGPNSEILTTNSRATELLGLTAEQLQGKTAMHPAWSFLEDDGLTPMPVARYPVNRVLASRQPLANQVLGINRPDTDVPVWVLVNAYPLFCEDHTLERVVVTFVDITTQKQAEIQLKNLSTRLELAVQASQIGIWEWDVITDTLSWDDRMLQLYGLTPAEFSGHNQDFTSRIHPEDAARVQAKCDHTLADATNHSCNIQYRIVWPDDSVHWMQSGATIQRDDDGQPRNLVGINFDITSIKQSAQALKHAKDQLELVLQASSEGFWDWDMTTNEIYFSPRWKEMLGYADHELDNTFEMWNSVMFDEDRVTALRLIEDYNGGQVDRFSAIQRFRHKDGSTVYILSRAVNVKDSQDRAIRMVGSHLDITSTIHAQAAFKNSELQLSGILNSSLDGIMAFRSIRNDQGEIIDFEWTLSNPKACQIVNKEVDELIGNRLLDILPGNRTDGLFDLYIQVVETNEAIQQQFHYNHDGINTWFENIAVPLEDGFVVTFRDISAAKQSEQALQQANSALELHLQDLRQRNDEMLLLSEISDFLQACRTIDEACSVITTLVQRLFPGCSGSFYITCASRNQVEGVAHWGDCLHSVDEFQPHACWALRRGRWHSITPDKPGLRCNHIMAAPPNLTTLCIPMIAQGETLGMFHLSTKDADVLNQPKHRLARTVAEQVGLAIANLHLRETLQNQSIRDGLTGLFNRRYLEEALQSEIARAQRHHYVTAVVMLDVDHFKSFNDQHGHDAGDVVLKTIAQVMQDHIRSSDIACRYGGEELTLVLPETSLPAALTKAEEIRQAIHHITMTYGGQILDNLTASLGVAVFPEHGTTGEAVIQAADAALYRAKGAGRNQVIAAKKTPEVSR